MNETDTYTKKITGEFYYRITKLRENCGKEFDAHWQCLENHNQELYACRKPERTFNTCVFEKLVSYNSYK